MLSKCSAYLFLDEKASSCHSSHNDITPRKVDQEKEVVPAILYEYSDNDVKLQIKECQPML